MFGLLNSSQMYGLQQVHDQKTNKNLNNAFNNASAKHNLTGANQKHKRSSSSLSDSAKESRFFASLSSVQGMKAPTNFIEKFIKSELLNGYDTFKNYRNFQNSNSNNTCVGSNTSRHQHTASVPESLLTSFNCLQGSYRSNSNGEFYETVNVTSNEDSTATTEMTIKCSKNLLAQPPLVQAPATLQNYQKLPECMQDLLPDMAQSSGASSGEFNSSDVSNGNGSIGTSFYNRLSFGGITSGRVSKHPINTKAQSAVNEIASDNSSSSISTTTTTSYNNTSAVSTNANGLQRTSSASSSSGDCTQAKKSLIEQNSLEVNSGGKISKNVNPSPERAQRRKLLQMISSYDQQNKMLQFELAKEKRRRTEELACVAKSLICIESKLMSNMKTVNQRLLVKDTEICRLVRQNRALQKQLVKFRKAELENGCDEGVVEDGEAELNQENNHNDKEMWEESLVLEALQCINCRKQFYDIELKECWTQTTTNDSIRNNDDHTTEHGSSSDDTLSSSFYGARRSVRYTSKRTSGTFRDYMRSRSMNIDDPALDNNSEENTSTISRDDSQTSYEKINIYSRTIDRMHGVKGESERESEQSGQETQGRPPSRSSSKSGGSRSSDKSVQMEEDDGIFSPTQDEDFEEDLLSGNRLIKIVPRRTMEFSEASPKQIYETSTDDWYASASDHEEIGSSASKLYGQGAINPVLECVNQILLQQSMEEPMNESPNSLENSSGSDSATKLIPKIPAGHLHVPTNLPRRSSLSGRRSSRSNSHSSDGQPSRNGTLNRKRVHFSTKNSMVHVPRNDDEDEDHNVHQIISSLQDSQYHPMNYFRTPRAQMTGPQCLQETNPEDDRLDTLNYESIYSNEYEPIGSDHNSSNLYVDMESTGKLGPSVISPLETKISKLPPALPPKPANLIKFKKSLQQLDEMPDEHLQQDCGASTSTTISEPDYCSISEVNVITSVKIVADVHKAPESEGDIESQLEVPVSEMDLEVSTVASDDICATSQKTDEIEEIFADIPKLPNVAAIIAPKNPKYQQQSDYLIMSPKLDTPPHLQNARKLLLNNTTKDFSSTIKKPTKVDGTTHKLQLHLNNSSTLNSSSPSSHYKKKHMPNILAEINRRMSLPNSPTTPTKPHSLGPLTPTKTKPSAFQTTNSLLQGLENNSPSLPLQAEFDWYNLDAEYGKAPISTGDLLKVNEAINSSNMLAEIDEDHESVVATADEYNLDEEFSLTCEQGNNEMSMDDLNEDTIKPKTIETLCSMPIIKQNFPFFTDNSPRCIANAKAKKIENNLANFEKFIEGSGLSTKPLPSKRKIYFAGPFV